MAAIELEIWETNQEKYGYLRYVNGRIAKDVFKELESHLESIGYLPEEYFSLHHTWENGRRIPRGAWFNLKVDYGSNEGIYLDMELYWYEEAGTDRLRCSEHFITGKTLRESNSALDRMHLIASSIRKAFHDKATHARYITIGNDAETPDSMILHVDSEEAELLVDSLLRHRLRQKAVGQPVRQTEQILRRLHCGIADYMKTVGERPADITDQDAIVLSVLDNNISEFHTLLPKVPELHNELLVLTAGRPGKVGADMFSSVLGLATGVPYDLYLQAIKKSLQLGDTQRVITLMEQAEAKADDTRGTIYVDAIAAAMNTFCKGIRQIPAALRLTSMATPAQLAVARPHMIVQAIQLEMYDLAISLFSAGVDFSSRQAEIYHALASHNHRYLFEELNKRHGDINAQNREALRKCWRDLDVRTAITLIDYGADYTGFRATLPEVFLGDEEKVFFEALDGYVARKAAEKIKEA